MQYQTEIGENLTLERKELHWIRSMFTQISLEGIPTSEGHGVAKTSEKCHRLTRCHNTKFRAARFLEFEG